MLSAVYMVSMFVGLAVALPVTVRAEETKTQKTQAAASSATKEASYRYVAQSSDSYSKMARKAIQTYGIKNKVTLSKARIIAAETWLTQDAKSPYLNQGESVVIKESAVKRVVDRAAKLSAAKEALWNAYTVGVNFNTNAVGQAL